MCTGAGGTARRRLESEVKQRNLSRRLVGVAAAALLATGALSACGGGGSTGGSGADKTLRITLANHVWTDVIKKDLPEFEKQSGLKVEVSQLSEDQLAGQYKVKLNAGSKDIDVMMYRPLQVGKLFGKSGYFDDLTKRVNSDKDWNWEDFQKSPRQLTTYEDKVVGVPMITEFEALYYRKDLLKKAGLDVPKTMDDLQSAAKKIHQDNPKVAGFVARTGRSAAVTQYSGFLYSFGGNWVDDQDNSAIASDAAKQAYSFYGGLLHNYGPAQLSTDMSWPEAMAIFTQGNAAFYPEASSLFQNATDKSKSKVADKVGFAALPAGPAGSKPYNVASWALGINSFSENQDNAWKFIQWATSKDEMLKIQKEGVPGSRTSVWQNPEATASFPDDLVKANVAAGDTGVGYDRPVVVSVAEAREAVGGPIVTAIQGGDVAAAAAKASKTFQQILDKDK